MDPQGLASAEERLAEFFVLPLFARESAWAEIAEDLIEYGPAPPSSPPQSRFAGLASDLISTLALADGIRFASWVSWKKNDTDIGGVEEDAQTLANE